jgi:hypothetical protein
MDRIDKKISMALAKYGRDPLTGIENLFQLFEGHEYAKLGADEKNRSHSWDFWNHSYPSLSNLPLQKG